MGKYTLVSGKVILAQVTRALGYKLPANYVDDVLEWTAEGLGMMQVTNSLIIESTGDEGAPGEIVTSNYCAKLPCGFVTIIAVEDDQGNRLPEGGDQTDLRSTTKSRGVNVLQNTRVSSFQVDPFQHQTTTGVPAGDAGTNPPYYISGVDITQSNVAVDSARTKHYYKVVGNYIQTSFETGYIKLHYYAVPVCNEGYPLIPDNANFRAGLEWHVIKRLIGAGYIHPVFNYDYANQQCELYMGRGMGEVSFYTPEGAAKLNRSLIRLIPPHNLYEDFFVNSETSENLYK